VPNPYKYHREIDSGVHTLRVLQAAVVLSSEPITRFAALVHDLGKILTPVKDWPKHYGHEENGLTLIKSLSIRLRIPKEYCHFALLVSRFHLTINRLEELRATTVVKVLEQTDAFRRSHLFHNLLLVCQADAEGCGRPIVIYKPKLWSTLLTECAKISPKELIEQGYEGIAIKEALHQLRVARVKTILNSWKSNEK
jgi:tRNA nucleotidyltransferase (CCA-adding enzyme)